MDMEQELETVLDEVQNDAGALEQLLTTYSGRLLHPNHFLMVAAKRYLLYQMDVTDPRRAKLAQEILPVFDVITPG